VARKEGVARDGFRARLRDRDVTPAAASVLPGARARLRGQSMMLEARAGTPWALPFGTRRRRANQAIELCAECRYRGWTRRLAVMDP
jgi:hypothetical protein